MAAVAAPVTVALVLILSSSDTGPPVQASGETEAVANPTGGDVVVVSPGEQ